MNAVKYRQETKFRPISQRRTDFNFSVYAKAYVELGKNEYEDYIVDSTDAVGVGAVHGVIFVVDKKSARVLIKFAEKKFRSVSPTSG